MKIDIPSIKISHTEDSTEYLKEIIYGIEEEGIPYEIISGDFSNEIQKAFEMAQNSRLSVGISVSRKNVIVHFSKLNAENPLFKVEIHSLKKSDLRIYGSNAARLIKGIPFKKTENQIIKVGVK